MIIDSLEDLRQLYAHPKERAVKKQLTALDKHCRAFIALSPFVVLASHGPAAQGGTMDASPRGGAPGFVLAPDAHTLLLPDAPGNNRLDTLENIVHTGKLGLLFMVPGVDETLRINGTAQLSTAPGRLALFAGAARLPKLVIEVKVAEAYLHCAKALMRSRLWHADAQTPRSALPTMGEMLRDQTGSDAMFETQEQMLARYTADL